MIQESLKSFSQAQKAIKIEDSSLYPSNISGLVKIAFYDRYKPQQIIGFIQSSAVLIANNIILTCAHNLKSPCEKTLPVKRESFLFHLGYNYCIGEKFKLKQILTQRQEDNFKDNKRIYQQNDFTLIQIDPPKQQFRESIVIQFQDLKDLFSRQKPNLEVNVFGYPIKQNKLTPKQQGQSNNNSNKMIYQFKMTGKLTNVQQKLIQYKIEGSQGLSGAPIFIKMKEEFILIGIHKGMNQEKKCAFGIPIWIIYPHIPKR